MKKLSTSVICVCLFFSLVGVSLESGAFDENAVGYKDIKIGQTIGYLESQGICKHFGLQSYHCYDSEWTFNIYGTGTNQTTYKTHGRVTRLDIRVGVYGKESHNKFRGLLKKKYDTVYNFGDIDIERFNNDEIDAIHPPEHRPLSKSGPRAARSRLATIPSLISPEPLFDPRRGLL